MADGRTGKGYPKAQHSNSSPLNNIAGHQHGRDTGASTRNWHGCGLPTRVVGVSARCPHRRALLTPARVISPSRCRQRASMPATSSRCRQLALALWGSALGSRPPSRPPSRPLPLGRAPSARGTHTRTPIYATRAAHKGLIPPLCAAPCFLIPSLVCGTGRGRGALNAQGAATRKKRRVARSGPTGKARKATYSARNAKPPAGNAGRPARNAEQSAAAPAENAVSPVGNAAAPCDAAIPPTAPPLGRRSPRPTPTGPARRR